MSLIAANMSITSQTIGGTIRTWEYLTTDASSVIATEGYFNSFTPQLKVGDRIYATTVDSVDPATRTLASDLLVLLVESITDTTAVTMGVLNLDNRGTLESETSATHSSVQSLGTVLEAGNPIVVQLGITTAKTATVLLYGRTTADMGWVLFDTIALTDTGFMQTYDGVPLIGWKVSAIDAAATVDITVAYDD